MRKKITKLVELQSDYVYGYIIVASCCMWEAVNRGISIKDEARGQGGEEVTEDMGA